MKKQQLIIQVFAFCLIFAIFAFFRFYNLDKRLTFDWDQEQFSYQIRDIILHHKFTLLGPRVVSDKGFFLAPYFTYLLAPIYLLTNLNPRALLYFIGLVNFVFFFLTAYIIKKIFGLVQSVSFLFLWACAYLLTGYDTIAWWPVLIPLGVIATWSTLYQIYKINSYKSWILLGVVLGFFMNMHFQFVFVILFCGLFFICLFLTNKKFSFDFKKIAVCLLVFLAFFIPLIIFDLRHQFLNISLFFNFFFVKETGAIHDNNIWLTVFTNFIDSLIYFRSIFLAKLFYFVSIFLIFFLYKAKKDFYRVFYLSTLTLWLTFPICFALYGKRPSEYYFVFLFPFVFIFIVDFFVSIKKAYLLLFFSFVFFLINFQKNQINIRPNIFSLYYKDIAVEKINTLTAGKKFNISFKTPLGANYGYKYLIDYYNIKRTGNWADPLVEIRIPPEDDDIRVQEIGIKIPKELR